MQKFTAIFSVFFSDEILKTSRVTSFIVIWKSCFYLLKYSESQKSTIIADKWMKFAGYLVMVVLNKGCGKK